MISRPQETVIAPLELSGLAVFGRNHVCIRIGPAGVTALMEPTSEEDIELDRLWRLAFKQPLPMLGAPDIAWTILNEHLGESVRGFGNAPRS